MNRLARWMMRLYPARWRERYGDELDALITDAGADTRTVADLARGGIRMQFSTWSFPKLAVVLGIAGILLGTVASSVSKTVYESKASLRMEGTSEQLDRLIAWAEPQVVSRTDLSSIVNDPRLLLYKEQMKVTPLDNVLHAMSDNIHMSRGAGQTIDIAFQYPDAAKAQQTVAILADRLMATSDQERAAVSSDPRPYFDVVDTANLPGSATLQRAVEWSCLLLGISIPFLWRKIRRRKLLSWWLLLSLPTCAFLGVISGELVAVYQSSGKHYVPGYRFRSTATMLVAGATQKQVQDLIDGVLTPASLTSIIQDRRLLLYSNELKKTPLEDVVQEMKHRMTIAPLPGHPNYITIAFEYSDRFRAQQTVEWVMRNMNDLWNRSDARATIVSFGTWGPLSIQSPASPPQPIGGDRLQYAGTGGLIGVILAAFIAAIRRRWTPESAVTQ